MSGNQALIANLRRFTQTQSVLNNPNSRAAQSAARLLANLTRSKPTKSARMIKRQTRLSREKQKRQKRQTKKASPRKTGRKTARTY